MESKVESIKEKNIKFDLEGNGGRITVKRKGEVLTTVDSRDEAIGFIRKFCYGYCKG